MTNEKRIEHYSEFIYNALTHDDSLTIKDMLQILNETRILIQVQAQELRK